MYLDKMMKKVTDFTGFFEGWGSGGGEVLENLFIVCILIGFMNTN